MDKALRFELNKITELNKKIYPTHAPEGDKGPYLVYIKSNYKQGKTLDGAMNNTEVSYLINVLSSSYSQAVDITEKVKDLLLTFPLRTIGYGYDVFINDMTIQNIAQTYEHELGLNRTIIEVDFSYKEE
jgi:hypothetical protein